MKNLLLILGIVLVSFTNVCNAKNTVVVFGDENKEILPKPILDKDAEISYPETVMAYNRKTSKEIIAEDDKIIENTVSDDLEYIVYEETMKGIITQSDLIIENSVSNDIYPLFNVRTIKDKITELEMIIESKETNEVKPLDSKNINSITDNLFDFNEVVGIN